ncbi:MAG: alpha/beta hydrolase, partial [Myxococcaceae bacterium]
SMAAMYSMYQMSRVLGTHRRLLRSSLVEMMPTAQLDPTQFEELLADAAAMPAESLVGFLRGLHQWNVEQQLGQVRIPTLLVWGGKDRLIPGHTMERMAESIPGCQRVFWEDVGHSPQFERPDELADTLFNFVRRGTLGLRIQWMLRQMLDARKRSRARSLRAGGT